MSVYLTVTIDTEEDNWGEFTRSSYTVENVRRVPRLQQLLVRHGIRPTYLVSYPIAASKEGACILGGYLKDGMCEIGAHPHPCNTPPFEEERTEINSYICNLPPDLQFRKIEALTYTIQSKFGTRPTSYRSGRWGFGDEVAKNLMRLGYTVDTSVFPEWNWHPGPDFRAYSHEPFVYTMDSSSNGRPSLLEIPVTVDYLQSPRALATTTYHAIDALPLGPTVLAALRRLRALNRVCLSPEMADAEEMIRLATTLTLRGTHVLNLFFHTPTLLEGCSPFTRTSADVEAFLRKIDQFLAFAMSAGFTPVTVSELTATAVGASKVRDVGSPSAAK